jgi:hypothetical protein
MTSGTFWLIVAVLIVIAAVLIFRAGLRRRPGSTPGPAVQPPSQPRINPKTGAPFP